MPNQSTEMKQSGSAIKGGEAESSGPKIEKRVSFVAGTESAQQSQVPVSVNVNIELASKTEPSAAAMTNSQVLGKRTSEAKDGP